MPTEVQEQHHSQKRQTSKVRWPCCIAKQGPGNAGETALDAGRPMANPASERHGEGCDSSRSAEGHGRDVTRRSLHQRCQDPSGVRVNMNGTRNAGSVYFHVSIIVANGLPPVSAAAANGERAVGGLTSDSTA